MMLPKLKKNNPFFLGNLVTNRSTISIKVTEREIRYSFDQAGQEDVGSEIGADLLKRELHSIVIHVGADFYNSDETDDFHVFG